MWRFSIIFTANILGQIEKQTGIGYSSLVDAMHQLSKRLKDVPSSLIGPLRSNMPMKQVGGQMVTMAMRGCFAHLKSASSEFARLVLRVCLKKCLVKNLSPEFW
jgi:hypothetical protein